MIVRIFRATIREGRVADFRTMVRKQSIPWLEDAAGLVSYIAGEPYDDDGDGAGREFVMITTWKDQASLEAFAGADWQAPVVTEDEAPLVEAMFADHYLQFDKD